MDIPNTWDGELTEVHENPTSRDLLKLIKASESCNLRILIEVSSNRYWAWDADGALHGDVIEHLRLDRDEVLCLVLYKDDYYTDSFSIEDDEFDSIVRYYGKLTPDKYLKKLSKLKFFKNIPIYRVWLSNNNKIYFQHESLAPTKSHILFNPTLSEIKKLIRQSIRNADAEYAQWKNDGGEDVRFFVKGDKYYVADANEYTHTDIAVELGRDVLAEDDLILGGIKEGGYVWFYKYMLLDYLKYPLGKRAWIPDDETKNMFKSTDFYKVIAPMVTDIEYK
jgi:hypothetical protein